MTDQTREIFDFAQFEPIAVGDMQEMLLTCTPEEVAHVRQVSSNLLSASDELLSDSLPEDNALSIQSLMLCLAAEGGSIVPSSECSVEEIAEARRDNRFAVCHWNYGFVHRPN
jgi:hypothetical protein